MAKSKTKKQNLADSIPLCPFPKGERSGIRCAKLIVSRINRRLVKICPEKECVYHEEL